MDNESGDDSPQHSPTGTFPTASHQSDNDDGVTALAPDRTTATQNISNSPWPPVQSRPAPYANAMTRTSSRNTSGTSAVRLRGSKYQTNEFMSLF